MSEQASPSGARIDDSMPPPIPQEMIGELMANARQASDFLKALSHETRLIILCLLSDGEKTVSELEDTLGLPQAIVSHSLPGFGHDDIVKTRREGRLIHYSIRRPEVVAVVQALHAMFCAVPGAAARTD